MILRGTVWLFVETLTPRKRWGLRVGNRWLTAGRISVGRVLLETRQQRAQPRMYLRAVYTTTVRVERDVIWLSP